MKSFNDILATLAVVTMLLAGCGGPPTPVNSAEVPAATEAKPSSGPAGQLPGAGTDTRPGGAAAPSAAPAAAPAAHP